MNIWMTLWYVTLMTSSFSQKTWHTMNAMYVLFWNFFEKLVYVKLEKCGFHQFEVEFLGYIISRNGFHMNLHKVQTIMDWAILTFV